MLKLAHLPDYISLTRLNRPIGIYLLLWPTLWALWIAGQGQPDLLVTLVFVAGVVLMRSAGCIINDFADRKIDLHVERTKNRPLTSGRISSREALTLFALLCAISFGLVLLMNWFTIALSVVAVLLTATYPFMKRYTHLPQVVLGMAFSWAIPMAFAAQTGELSSIAMVLFLTNVIWTVAYDTLYAMTDRPDDVKIGVKSTAILFGNADKLIVGGLQIIVIALLIAIGAAIQAGLWYYLGIAGAAATFIYQQWMIKDRVPARCFQAFLHNHWSGMIIFAGIMADYGLPF